MMAHPLSAPPEWGQVEEMRAQVELAPVRPDDPIRRVLEPGAEYLDAVLRRTRSRPGTGDLDHASR